MSTAQTITTPDNMMNKINDDFNQVHTYHIAGKLEGIKFGKFTHFEHLAIKSLENE